jgi:hypothetical protein
MPASSHGAASGKEGFQMGRFRRSALVVSIAVIRLGVDAMPVLGNAHSSIAGRTVVTRFNADFQY